MIEIKITGDSFEEVLAEIRGVVSEPISVPPVSEPISVPPVSEPVSVPVLEPVSVPPVSVPPVSVPVPEPVSVPVDVDKRGVPYDSRIHSSSKNLNKDGSWRYVKKVDKNLAREIEAASLAVSSVANLGKELEADVTPAPPVPPVPPVTQNTNVTYTFQNVVQKLRTLGMGAEQINAFLKAEIGYDSIVVAMAESHKDPTVITQIMNAIHGTYGI